MNIPKEKQKRLESKSIAKELIGEKDKSLLFFRVPYLDPAQRVGSAPQYQRSKA
jgi:hypothetical protein